MHMRLSPMLAAVAAIAATLTLSACGTGPAAGPATNAPAPQQPPAAVQSANLSSALVAHTWTLESAKDAQGKRMDALFTSPARPVKLSFTGGRIGIQGGCNSRGGGFQVNAADQLVVGQMVSTMMACEAPLMAVDKALTDVFAKPAQLRMDKGTPPRMTLVTAANETLVFTGTRTPESLYGAPTQIFLEVGPQKVACNNPMMPNAQCLQVRERKFDAQGLPSGTPGPWQPLNGTIEGFTHEAGYSSVLRVKRFNRQPVPADASAYLMVLDLVVETRIAK